MGSDPRGIHDRFTDYFDNNRAQALINRQYCIHNPHHWQGYGKDTWGYTAVDGPEGYVPYEQTFDLDDGTLLPRERSVLRLHAATVDGRAQHFYRNLGTQFGRSTASATPSTFRKLVFRHNHGPESGADGSHDRKLSSGLVWKNFMANPEFQSGSKI